MFEVKHPIGFWRNEITFPTKKSYSHFDIKVLSCQKNKMIVRKNNHGIDIDSDVDHSLSRVDCLAKRCFGYVRVCYDLVLKWNGAKNFDLRK